MKNFTKNLMLVAAAATALSAGAEATWQFNHKSNDFSVAIQGGRGVMADFTNNGHLDIYYSGNAWNAIYDHPGLWSWLMSSNMIINNGDGTFTEDIIKAVPTGEYDEANLDDQGNPKEKYTYGDPNHGIYPTKWGHYVTFDYNCDGLVDLLVSGITNSDDHAGYRDRLPEHRKFDRGDNSYYVTILYKNMGDGKFEPVEDCNLPFVVADRDNGQGMFFSTMVAGDYDHDGYADVALCGLYPSAEPGEPDRVAQLWRNIDGTGRFEQMNIAETIGGAWTKKVTETVGEGDDAHEELLLPAQELPGWFMLISGNVTMADINNDGWLDLVFDGWTDTVNDGVYENGSNGRVYLNQEGKKFVDITNQDGGFYLTRAGSTQLADINGDGYLDLINGGYGDHGLGWKTLYFNNNLGDDPTADPTSAFDFSDSMANYGLPEMECMSLVIRDFDGDDILDFGYIGNGDSRIWYGDMGGNYTGAPQLPIRGASSSDGLDCFGDLYGNGLVDRFVTGYNWVSDNHDGVNYRELLGSGDWSFSKFIFNNTTDVEIVAPDAPTNIKTSFNADDNTVTIEWDDVESPNCAYNVVVMTPSGKIMANIPVDPVTGFVKVAENKNVCIRPFVNKYTLPAKEVGEYKLGVQAVSLNNEKASSIAWGENVSGVGTIISDVVKDNIKVTVNGNAITANADTSAEVKIVDMMGRTVAAGMTNEPISVDANGVFIVTAAGQSVKVVK